MTEASIVKLRRPHARTVRPHQWHSAKEDPIAEKKLRRGVSPDMIEGMVAAPTFNAFHQPPSCIYVEKIPKQCCLGRRNLQGVWEGI